MTRAITKRRPKDAKDSFSTLTDSDRYDLLRRYRLGEMVSVIAKSKGLDEELLKQFFSDELKALNTIQEINKLTLESRGIITTASAPVNLINEKFLENVDDKKDAYAYYYAMTGSNEHALREAGLDLWLPKGIGAKTKRYTLSVRGKFIRDLPGITKYINDTRDTRLNDLNLDKSYVQSELVTQIEELKEIAGDDPRYRTNLLKGIELLGRTLSAFTDNIRIEEVNPKSGLEILMKRAKAEAAGEDPDTFEMECL